jgi:uracil-DNA glycosylase
VYPDACDTFAALNWCPLDDVKVVIVGQDPYHGHGQAHGLCFSVRKGLQIPPSLRNIYQELRDDPLVNFPVSQNGMPKHGSLERWAKQGVLMLNSVLTVRKGQAFSHQKKGWEQFTDEIIRILDQRSQESGKGLVFLLWGKPASEKTQALLKPGVSNHTIIFSSHPSPLAARKTNTPFLGSKCFSRANDALEKLGHKPIDWNVDEI